MRHIPFYLVISSLLPAVATAQQAQQAQAIENALSAAPPAVAREATVADQAGNVLRPGTNGFVCLPDNPAVPNNAPMCLDQTWRDFIAALMKKETPKVNRIGIAYMLQGDMPVSNTDPFATGPTPTNQWVQDAGPHVMLVVPDAATLESLPTDPENGGPWVMWKGTPYAHIMVPVPGGHSPTR